jgi:hypothetical protein
MDGLRAYYRVKSSQIRDKLFSRYLRDFPDCAEIPALSVLLDFFTMLIIRCIDRPGKAFR